MSGEESHRAPDTQKESDCRQEHNSPWPILGVFNPFGGLALTVLPPGQPISDEQGKTETEDQLRQKVLEVEQVSHGWHGNAE